MRRSRPFGKRHTTLDGAPGGTYGSPVPIVSKPSPNSGPVGGGTVVTITGLNLAGAIAVDFGSAAAHIDKTVAASEIQVTSPKGSGTVDVTVRTAGGTSLKTAADHYSYVAVPIVSKLSPNKANPGKIYPRSADSVEHGWLDPARHPLGFLPSHVAGYPSGD